MNKKGKLKIWEYQESYKKYYEEGWKKSRIAKYLGRARSTLSRLFARDVHPCPGIWKRMTSYEKAMYAWEKRKKRASSSRKRLKLKSHRIQKLVVFLLSRWHWSPETISDFLDKHGIKLSAKSIYNFTKTEKPWLVDYLRRRGKPRRQRVARKGSYFKEGAPARKSIHSRPEITEPGHWELDTIHSIKGSKGGVLTLRELSSKKRFYWLIPDLEANTTIQILIKFFHDIPAQMRKTILADNGPENAELYKLEKVFEGFNVYYCDPYKAYQRGSVENANGELRWYYPKKTDFSQVTEKELRRAQWLLNNKPMKCLGKISAKKAFEQKLAA